MDRRPPRSPIAMPSGHFMALAPLDVWARLLWKCRFAIGLRYFPRLVFALGASLLATVITLPERLLLSLILRARFGGGPPTLELPRSPVFVLGYYRTGTTHLHNLLSTHPDVVTPRWVQAMCPQGFWLSWAFLRWALVPFLPNTRPQDDVAFGPDWPAEDDFAHCNWALASTLPERLVLPRSRGRWSAFHALRSLSHADLARWQRVMAAFAWKVTRARPNAALLLKTPSHTARLAELERMFGQRARYVHLSRSSADVVRSNVAMHTRTGTQSLQDLPEDAQTREHVVTEYAATVETFLRDVDALDLEQSGRLVYLRYDALVAKPLAELRRVCAVLDLRWDEEVERRAGAYLAGVGEYTPRHRDLPEDPDPRLAEIDRLLAARGPAVAEEPEPEHAASWRRTSPGRLRAGIAGAWIGAGLCLALWLGLAHLTGRRLDILAWPLGGVVGAIALRAAGRGDWRLGIWASGASLAMVLATVWPLPEIANGWGGPDRLPALRDAYGSFNNNYLWILFGLASAARYATRRFVRPPGMG